MSYHNLQVLLSKIEKNPDIIAEVTRNINILKGVKSVNIESSYRGDDNSYSNTKENLLYGRLCILDCISRGESPSGSHFLLTQTGLMEDSNLELRDKGIIIGGKYRVITDLTAVYWDKGISEGMWKGIYQAMLAGKPIEFRTLWEKIDINKEIKRLANKKQLILDGLLF